MNTLDDLRTTLHDHAHDLSGLDPINRSSGIRARIAGRRRRRNAVRGGVAIAAVAAVVGGVMFTDVGGQDIRPASELGAPESFTALGWTYALADAVETDGPTQTISLPASERPTLISWKTEGESQDVTVTSKTPTDTDPDEDNSIWSSSAADWADHVVIDPGPTRKITVSARGPVDAIAVATYEIDPDEMPAGKGSGKTDGFHFRDRVADRVLVDAAIAQGGSEITFDYAVPNGRLTLTHTCSGVPKGGWVRISLDGSDDANTFVEGCDNHGIDPGAGSNYSIDVDDEGWSKQGKVRMWVSRSEKDPTPVPASELTATKLGVGLYLDTSSEKVFGTDVHATVESSGHTWELVESASVDSGAQWLVDSIEGSSGDIAPWLLQTAHEATTDDVVSLTIEADGKAIPHGLPSSSGKEISIMGNALVPPWTRTVSLVVAEGSDIVARQALLFYRMID